MGMDRLSDLPRFLLANGSILPRKVYTALGRHVVPFNWIPKPVLRIPLPPSLEAADEVPVSRAAVNTVVQVPDEQASAAAIAAITGAPSVAPLKSVSWNDEPLIIAPVVTAMSPSPETLLEPMSTSVSDNSSDTGEFV